MKDSEPKFTPVPWHIEDMWHILDKSGYMIASTSQRQDEEETANAQLIAAAPEMYEAIKRNVLLIKALADTFKTRNHDDDDEFSQDLYKKATELDNLLAKARGEIREKA